MNKRIFQLSIVFVLVLSISFAACGQVSKFPGKTWEIADKPEDYGYSSQKLAEAQEFTKTIRTAAVTIVVNGVIIDEWGEVERKFMTHSTRKSFLSAMYGKYVRNGTIDLTKTMWEIGIDDEPPLSAVEKEATIHDCIKARSGIYHTALYESAGMKRLKPERHTQKPGTHWYYNNWDFNVLGTIFEKFTGKKIFEAMKEEIADPIGMEHFEAEDGEYVTGRESIHAAYPFIITAHDMARFGLLMLRKGNWNGNQVIPADWVEESTDYYSDAALYSSDGYGYMWWVVKKDNNFPHLPGVELEEGTFSARGAGGHYILVIPDRDMIIVHRVNTFENNSVSSGQFGRLVRMILDAKIN
ncbi:serine hydrolase domain-containing protein [candidate division KSB1 bacterium]